eukprot:2811027-Lingulodinium_polyedra.AAC.1
MPVAVSAIGCCGWCPQGLTVASCQHRCLRCFISVAMDVVAAVSAVGCCGWCFSRPARCWSSAS